MPQIDNSAMPGDKHMGLGAIVVQPQAELSVLNDDQPEIAEEIRDPMQRINHMVRTRFLNAQQKRKRMENIWYLALCNDEGFYLKFQSTDVEDSQFFFKITRQCNVEAESKLIQFVTPPHERVWELQPSSRPWAPWLNKENPADPKANKDALDKMTVVIEDDFDTMDFDTLKRRVAEALPRYGTAVLLGPFRHPNPPKRFINKAAMTQAAAQPGQPGDPTSLDAATDFLELPQPDVKDEGWVEVTDPADERRPYYTFEPCWNLYPDPDSENVKGMTYFIHRDHYNKSYIRGLLDDPSFDAEQVERLLKESPSGFFEPQWWEGNQPLKQDRERYTIFRWYGFLNDEDFDAMGLSPEDYKATPKEAVYEVWTCGRHTLKVKRREFQDDVLPLKMVPMDKRDGSPWGRGTSEKLFDVQDIMNSLARALHDDIRHSMGANAVVDMNAIVPGTDLSIRGRKTWPVRRTELTPNGGKPVEYFLVPSQQELYMRSLLEWKKIAPEIAGLPRMLMPAQMGSGVRTDGMLDAIYEGAENFIKVVIGNIDEYFLDPIVDEVYSWNMQYNPTEGIHGDFKAVALGVRGALAREIVGKKSLELFQTMQQTGIPDVLDDFTLMRSVVRGIGLDGNEAVLSVKDYLAKKAAQMAEEKAKQAAGISDVQEKQKAEASIRDVLMQDVKSTDQSNPTWVPKTEALYKQLGLYNGSMRAGLAIWAKKLATDYERAGVASPEQAQELLGDLANPGELQNAQAQPQLSPGPEDQAASGPMPENQPTAEPTPPAAPPR